MAFSANSNTSSASSCVIFLIVLLTLVVFTSQESGLPLFSVALCGQTRINGKIKASLRIPRVAVGLPYRKHKKRLNAIAFSSAKYRPVEISYVSLGDRFAAIANCYGDKGLLRHLSVLLSY